MRIRNTVLALRVRTSLLYIGKDRSGSTGGCELGMPYPNEYPMILSMRVDARTLEFKPFQKGEI